MRTIALLIVLSLASTASAQYVHGYTRHNTYRSTTYVQPYYRHSNYAGYQPIVYQPIMPLYQPYYSPYYMPIMPIQGYQLPRYYP